MKKLIVVFLMAAFLMFLAGCHESSTNIRVSTYRHKPIRMGCRGFHPRSCFYRPPVIVHQSPIIVHKPVVVPTRPSPGPHRGPMMNSMPGPHRGPGPQMRGGDEGGRGMRNFNNGDSIRGRERSYSRSAGK